MSSENDNDKKKTDPGAFVTFVADPFGLPTLAVARAQQEQDELKLDDWEFVESPAASETIHEQNEQIDEQDLEQALPEQALEEKKDFETELLQLAEAVSASIAEAEAIQAQMEEPASDEQILKAEEIEADLLLEDPAPIITPDPEQLDRLAEAIAQVEAEARTQAEEMIALEEGTDAEERLAAEIAEDRALAEEEALAKEEVQAEQAPEHSVEPANEVTEPVQAAEAAETQTSEAAESTDEETMETIDPELQAALPKSPVEDENGNLDLAEMESCIESLLFMTDKPISIARLHELLGPDFKMSIFQEAMTSLRDRYKNAHHGIEIVEVAGGFQFRTKLGRAPLAKKLAKVTTQRLSSGAMQTLAIVAYRQPVMKEDIDKVRGVDSSYFVRGLLERKLIQISGRSDLPGRPMLYTTTPHFLELFGLKDQSALPSLHEVEKMIPASQTANPEDEDPRIKEMRRLVGQMKSDTSTTLVYNPREDEKILKEIRERINSIPTSTPYLEEQKAREKAEAEAAALAAANPGGAAPVVSGPIQPELPVTEAPLATPLPVIEAPAPEIQS